MQNESCNQDGGYYAGINFCFLMRRKAAVNRLKSIALDFYRAAELADAKSEQVKK